MTAGRRLMVIFSVGGLGLAVYGRSATLRCQPAVLTLAAEPEIVLDPFPATGLTGSVGEGRARVMRGEVEVEVRSVRQPPARCRWDDLDVLTFAASTLCTWIILPALFGDPAIAAVAARGSEPPDHDGLRRVEVDVPRRWPVARENRHVLHVDSEGLVRRHEEGPFVHDLGNYCDFGGTMVATRRRTRIKRAGTWLPLLWADVVAAHAIPDHPRKS